MVDMCHIAAASSDGPRYDPSQSDEDRNGFGNLILLCPNHHRRIDAQPEVYPTTALQQMKQDAASSRVESVWATRSSGDYSRRWKRR